MLDVSQRATVSTALDLELSRDEDSVQSLATLATKEGLVVFAGINSSAKEQQGGRNRHFRSFQVAYPPRKRRKTADEKQEDNNEEEAKGRWATIGACALFKAPTESKPEMYQRLLRLSPPHRGESSSKRIAAVATGLAKKSQIVVFDATTPTPKTDDILTHIDLSMEADDLDIAETEPGHFSVAYCTDFDIYEQSFKYNFEKKTTERRPNGPRRVHEIPLKDTAEKPIPRPKFRSLRFLNPQNVVALANRANKSGAELQIFHLYPTGPANMVLQGKLPGHVKQATALDVCALDADREGNQQFVVAVAGQDISIEVFTTNYHAHTDTFSPFRPYLSIRDTHQHQMTKIAFSPFHPAPDSTAKQYVRLASTSYGNSVVIDTFPLQALNSEDEKGPTRQVLSHPNDEAWAKWTYGIVVSIVVIVVAFMLQSFISGFGGTQASGPFSFLPRSYRNFLDQPARAARGSWAQVPDVNPPASTSEISVQTPSMREKQAATIYRLPPAGLNSDDGLTKEIHPDKSKYLENDPSAKHWHELSENARVAWKARLKKAGKWVESEGESVLVGMLFSEYAGLVGEGLRGVVGEL